MSKKSAIIGFGQNLPKNRIKISEIADQRGEDGEAISASIGVNQKTVPDASDDAFTLAFEAGKQAIQTAAIKSTEVGAVFVGSESHPYAVKPTSGMVADALRCDPFCHCADLEFACKAGTAGLQIVDSMVRAGQIRYGLAIGSDTAQAKPGDALEYTAAAGSAAFIIGSNKSKNALCQIDHTLSYTTDTPDFWRGANEKYPSHAGRFTGEPGYFHHVRTTIDGVFTATESKPGDFDHVVLHMPNGKFPQRIAKEFGFTESQMELGFIVPEIGNTYSACSLLGLANVLQEAKKDQKILLVSYGSGAGCDGFTMTMIRDGMKIGNDSIKEEQLSYKKYNALVAARDH